MEDTGIEAMEELLDSARPHKESLPTGIARATYLGMLAAIETLGYEWCQLDSGQHVILGGPLVPSPKATAAPAAE